MSTNGTSGSPPGSSTRSKSPVEAIADLTAAIQALSDLQLESITELQQTQRQLTQLSNDTTAASTRNEQLSELASLQRQIAESLAADDFRRELKTLTGAATSLTKASTSVADRSDAEIHKVTDQLAGLRADLSRVRSEVGELDRATAGQLAGPLQRAEALVERVDRLTGWSWALGGRLLAGGVLLIVALGAVFGVLWGFAGLLGVPEVTAAIWGSFEAADAWWGKSLWAIVGLTFVGVIGCVTWRLISWLVEAFR